jgi:hypothetical protein
MPINRIPSGSTDFALWTFLLAVIVKCKPKERSHNLLVWVGPGDQLPYLPAQLSRGKQQRVAIARAPVNTPRMFPVYFGEAIEEKKLVVNMNLLLHSGLYINGACSSPMNLSRGTSIIIMNFPKISGR